MEHTMPGETILLKSELNHIEPDKRLAYGFFSVTTENGEPVVDEQGDVIDTEVLVEAAQAFITKSREGRYKHDKTGEPIAEVVESLVFTNEIQKYLGIDLKREGWFGCLKFHDDTYWEKVKNGETLGLSIGGSTQFVVLDEE